MRRLLCLIGLHKFRRYYDSGWMRCECGAIRKVDKLILR
jgi:hypothetical protein